MVGTIEDAVAKAQKMAAKRRRNHSPIGHGPQMRAMTNCDDQPRAKVWMMTDQISFELVSPERLLLSEAADMVTVPGREGDFGVLAGHAPVISSLRPGVIDVKGGTQGDTRFFVVGGFAEVGPQKLTILAEEVLPLGAIRAADVEARIAAAQEDALQAKTEADRARAAEIIDQLKVLRAAL